MTRRTNSQQNVRKITKVGQTSLSVTIPVDIVRKLGLRERQKVAVTEKNGKIIIEDWPNDA
ncbi:MAG TPA: AbrB/MazE/SpoVT family DNA-binding domain-containing protein [Candidatus Saccharimonadales bacterium]|nr:AbrB/MazE/SpoVT family DNA-binding domain-containing protein [Candidatus Saccharimonadales bacterium]